MNSEIMPQYPLAKEVEGGPSYIHGSDADNVCSSLIGTFVDVDIKHEVFESEESNVESSYNIEDDSSVTRDNIDINCKSEIPFTIVGVCEEAIPSENSKDINNREKPFDCNYCGKTFARKTNHRRHIMIHTGEKPFTCSHCEKTFAEKNTLKLHLMTHTGEKPFSCSYCGKTFAHKISHKVHLMTHTGEKPFSCNLCGKTFADKSNHKQHLMTHTGEKPYSCSYCDKTFAHKSNHKQHLMTHTGEKPFTCRYCSKTFLHKSRHEKHLKIHFREQSCTVRNKQKPRMASHTKDKVFSCSYCGKIFTQKAILIDHMQTHSGERPYYCNYCENIYTTEIALKYHVRSHIGASSDQNGVSPGFQRLDNQAAKWSFEKRKILFCFAYSRYEKWGSHQNAIFDERLRTDLPSEKIEANSIAKFEFIVSHIAQYLPIEEIRKVEQEAQAEADIDFQSDGDENEHQLSQWDRKEEWTLLWAWEYAKVRYRNWKDRCREGKVIFDNHCPNKKGLSLGSLLVQKYSILIQRSFTDSEIYGMREEVNALIKSKKCPLANPLEVPSFNSLLEEVQNRESKSSPEIPNPSLSILGLKQENYESLPILQTTFTMMECLESTSSSNLEHPGILERPRKREEPFRCSSCGKTFSNKDSFINHMSIHISTGSWEQS